MPIYSVSFSHDIGMGDVQHLSSRRVYIFFYKYSYLHSAIITDY